MSSTPRRSPRIQEKYGASPRKHMSLEEHPYKDLLRAKRYPYDEAPRPDDQKALCALTALVSVAWLAFFGSVYFNDWKQGRTPFSWELGSTFNHPFSFP
jgi:hypothetical protein